MTKTSTVFRPKKIDLTPFLAPTLPRPALQFLRMETQPSFTITNSY
jgi:hypothetical protein